MLRPVFLPLGLDDFKGVFDPGLLRHEGSSNYEGFSILHGAGGLLQGTGGFNNSCYARLWKWKENLPHQHHE
jgi:hypothetical protein